MKKLSWIRTGLLLAVLIFAVLGGNFLFTGAESASPLDMASDAVPIAGADHTLTQIISPEYAKVTAISLALQPPGGMSVMSASSGDLTLTLSYHATGAQVYHGTFSLDGVPDHWYIDFPVDCRLDPDALYDLSLYAENYEEGMNPSLYFLPLDAQIPEITENLTGGGNSSGNETPDRDSLSGDNAPGSGSLSGDNAAGSGSLSGDNTPGSSSLPGDNAPGSGSLSGDNAAGSGSLSGDNAAGSGSLSGDNTPGSGSLPDGSSAAVRLTYHVPVPTRIVIFFIVLVAVLAYMAATAFLSRKGSDPKAGDITLGKFLSLRIRKVPLIHILYFGAVTIAAILLRIAFLPVKSNDYYLCFESWINDMRSSGIWNALGRDIGDYPPLYVTPLTLLAYLPFEPVVIIKIMPCLFDFVLALACVKLARCLNITALNKRLALYAAVLVNPLTLLDSAAWGQCDSIYSSFILLALLSICGAMLWRPDPPSGGKLPFWKTGDGICLLFAIAFSFKLQAVFFLPILCLLWITQKRNVLKPVHLLWVPIIYTVVCIPMYLAGRSLKVMFKIYLAQADRNYGTLTLNYPNLYNLIGSWSEELYDSYFVYGMLLTFLLLITLFYQIYCCKVKLDSLTLCKVTALSVLTICFCLPLVHERYAYIAEMLLFIIMFKEPKHIKTALVTMLCTLFTYCAYLMQLEQSFSVLPHQVIALARLGVILYLIWDIFHLDSFRRGSSHKEKQEKQNGQ